jgi:hypothetical protein
MNGVQGGVPRQPSGNDTPVAIRVPDAWLKRAEALRDFLSARPGLELSRSDLLRICIARGLEAIEAERAAAKPSRRK